MFSHEKSWRKWPGSLLKTFLLVRPYTTVFCVSLACGFCLYEEQRSHTYFCTGLCGLLILILRSSYSQWDEYRSRIIYAFGEPQIMRTWYVWPLREYVSLHCPYPLRLYLCEARFSVCKNCTEVSAVCSFVIERQTEHKVKHLFLIF